MNKPNTQTNNRSTLILKTNFFNDEEFVSNSLQIELADNASTIDIGNKSNANFTNADWDRILTSILLSAKVITT